jgi:hypothetical protein
MPASTASTDRFAQEAEPTAAAERRIQQDVDRKESARPKQKQESGAMQPGARRYPRATRPWGQYLEKPGNESNLDLEPMFNAPHYKGSELKDKVALITSGDSAIGRSVAILFARQGADARAAPRPSHPAIIGQFFSAGGTRKPPTCFRYGAF